MANEKSFDAVDTVGKAYKAGYDAALKGLGILDCPYQERRLINAWDAGFDRANSDSRHTYYVETHGVDSLK